MAEANKENADIEHNILSHDFAKALAAILESASFMYPAADFEVRFSVALVGEMQKNEFANLVSELPVVADIVLNKDLGEKAAILLDVQTASALASFVSSGKPKKMSTLGEEDIASLRDALSPIVESFSTACDEAAGRAFGSMADIGVLDSYSQKRMVEELPESLYRATVSVMLGPRTTGKIAIVLPSNLAELLTETEAAPTRRKVEPEVRAYEHIELNEEGDKSSYSGAHTREPIMENIDLILDIQLKLTARLGQVEMPVGEIMKLAPGSVIDIDRFADEPIELVVNDRPIARGEIVVVQENFGVKITEIISPKDRIKSLK